jgi:hypothetical protein
VLVSDMVCCVPMWLQALNNSNNECMAANIVCTTLKTIVVHAYQHSSSQQKTETANLFLDGPLSAALIDLGLQNGDNAKASLDAFSACYDLRLMLRAADRLEARNDVSAVSAPDSTLGGC